MKDGAQDEEAADQVEELLIARRLAPVEAGKAGSDKKTPVLGLSKEPRIDALRIVRAAS